MREYRDEPLALRTTLGVGGPARRLVEVGTVDELETLLHDVQAGEGRFAVLGGGSNVVAPDEGLEHLVIQPALRGISERRTSDDEVQVFAAAGETWDDLVAALVGEGLEGLECLSGIPGWVGAAPIQNIGAYGQEIASCLSQVHVFDTGRGIQRVLPAAECEFGYRTSVFKRERKYIILGVDLKLRRGGSGGVSVMHPELLEALKPIRGRPSGLQVREAVLAIRRKKSMVVNPSDPDSRSVGSFFVNPVLSAGELSDLLERIEAGLGTDMARGLPRYAVGKQRFKVAAAWLIEQVGFKRGHRFGNVGLSTKHTLSIVNRGGGTAGEVMKLAQTIRDAVEGLFGVRLEIEPTVL